MGNLALQGTASLYRLEILPLTSLRFFAAVYVVIFHYWTSYHLSDTRPLIVELGHTGVTFFFLLSGFILSYSYNDGGRFPKDGRVKFYLARFARIYPVYIATIVVMFPALFLLRNSGVADQVYREIWAVTAPFALHAWIPGAACSLNCPNWSISTEAFFYLLFPLVFEPVYRRPVLVIVLAFAVMAITWFTQIESWLDTGRSLDAMRTVTFASDPAGDLQMQLFSYFPLTRFPEFLIGIGLYGLWKQGADQIAARQLYLVAGVGALLILATAHWVPENVLRTGWSVICFAPLVLAAANTRSGFLSRPDIVWLGKISFALYLVHSPVDSYLRTVDRMALGSRLSEMPFLFCSIAIVIALISAALLFHCVEEPARRVILASVKRSRTTC
jgi:peptidoglycan/LPS O-acetylase OafA/YrhL